MKTTIFIFLIALSISLFSLNCDTDIEQNKNSSDYSRSPEYLNSHFIIENNDTLKPLRIHFYNDTLFVSYVGQPKIDLYDLKLNKISSIPLTHLDTVIPSSFDIFDTTVIVTELHKQRIVLYDRLGNVKTSFGSMPDETTVLSPFNVIQFGGVAYVSDLNSGSILAVSIVDAENITEVGELILTIPSDTAYRIGFPSALSITPDGRLLVGDAKDSEINVFTCDGQYIYNYDSIPHLSHIAPQGFAYDQLIDPELLKLDSNSFDPSGIRYIGRTHITDPNNAQIHMYNPNGKYISSYPKNSEMEKPSGIAIDKKNRRIYIADPSSKKIFVFSY